MKFHKFLVATFVVIFVMAAVVSADWKDLGNSRGPSELKVKHLGTTGHEIKVEITVPGYHMKKVMVNDKECVEINIPGSSYLMKESFPMVPKMGKLVKMEGQYCNVTLKLLEKEEVTVDLPAPIIPSKGHMNRDVNPEMVPFVFGPIYEQDVFWPEEKSQFQVGKPFAFRETHGVRIEILPILANHVQMKMKVLKRAVVALVCEGLTATRSFGKVNKSFHKMVQDTFLMEENVRGGSVPDANNKKLVVVTPADLQSGITEWVAWKQKCGYEVTVKSVASGTSASTIKSLLQGLYDNASTKFGYVVLIGDANANSETAQPMPTFKGKKEGAAADRVYVRLAGNDNYPDAFISRVSDTTAAGIKAQLAKIIAYEQNPTAGDWFTKGVCIASNQGSPTDYERAEWIQNGGGSSQKVPVQDGGMIKHGVNPFDDIYDPSANAGMVTNAVNDGRSVIFYIGHGSATSWGTTGFSNSNVKSLTNGGKLPVIWSVACVNGQFATTGECFAEAWLRKADGGAVAMEAASTNESWVPPCDKQAGTINAIINKSHYTFGALEAVGLIKSMEAWGDTDSSEGNKMAEQCNLFGDCTMLVRTKKPVAITVQNSRPDTAVSFQISGEGRAVESATVTVYTEDMSFVVASETDASGNVNISLENAPAGAKLYYTVVGSDLISEVDKLIE